MTAPSEPNVRPQYHFRPGKSGYFAWNVSRLIQLSQDLPIIQFPLSDLAEIDELWWYQTPGDTPTPRSIAAHIELVRDVDVTHPIILSKSGRLMDGMHRVLKALLENRTHISARRFEIDPEPDHENYWPSN